MSAKNEHTGDLIFSRRLSKKGKVTYVRLYPDRGALAEKIKRERDEKKIKRAEK
jgi:hypothetical protein